MTLAPFLSKLERHQSLTSAEARAVIERLLSGEIGDGEIIKLLGALRDKGETAEEVAGFAEVMRERAAGLLEKAGVRLNGLRPAELLDTCGTGGDGFETLNLSTATALLAAASGARVAKHGNRSISSRSGSADVLEALGVSLELPLERILECLEKTGMVFLFAPHLHLAMRHVMNARRALKTKTIFNLLGPLTNPLGAGIQLTGVYDRSRVELMAKALASVGTRRAFVVHALEGFDEISTSGPTLITETADQTFSTREVAPEDFGLRRAPPGAVRGGDAATNARLIRAVLDGHPGHHRDAVLANTSAALVLAGKAADFREGVEVAAEALDSGRARQTLAALVEFTQKHRP